MEERRVVFQEDYCKSCSLCLNVCPQDIIYLSNQLNGKGYRPATVTDQDACISCMKCAQICPDAVITVYRPEKKKSIS